MSAQGIVYRQMRPGEEAAVSELMVRSFDEFIGAGYPRSGVRDFLAYVSTQSIRERLRRQHTILVAVDGVRIVGVVDIGDYRHIDLLFVEKAYHGKGIARELVQRCVELALEARPTLKELTADTSASGQRAYESMGFEPVGPEMVEHGRHFRRMRLKLKQYGRR
jgi:GNAT superfamily N-acetyltransferase